MVRKGGTVNFFGVAPRGGKVQPRYQPPALFGITLKATFPPYSGDGSSRVRADHGEKSGGKDYITGRSSALAVA